MFFKLGRTSICELLSIVTSSAAPISSRCSSFQFFCRMWSIHESDCLQRSSITQVAWVLSFIMVTQCFAEHLQTRHSLQPNSDVRSHNLDQQATSNIMVAFSLHLTRQCSLSIYLGICNGCFGLPHISTAFTQDLTSEVGPKHILKLPPLSDQAGLIKIITQ